MLLHLAYNGWGKAFKKFFFQTEIDFLLLKHCLLYKIVYHMSHKMELDYFKCYQL